MQYIPKNFQKEDLPVAATFKAERADRLQIYLVACKETFDPVSRVRIAVKDDDSPLRLECKGGLLEVKNKKILDLLLNHSSYKSGLIHIDYEDPTGFWRAVGALEVEMRPVLSKVTSINMTDKGTVDLSGLSKIKPEEVQSVVK